MPRTIFERIHNPRNLTCGCDPDCWCKVTPVGRLLRWYTSARWHKPVSLDRKRARA